MFFGAVVGILITRSVWGAVIGAIIGQMFDQGVNMRAAQASATISEVFFRSTFELMGHVAKSDGRVSESEIDAARRLMQELRLGPNEITAAIAYFRAGKSAAYDPNLGVEQLREACGLRDSRTVMRDYAVPADVQARMGLPPPPPQEKRRPLCNRGHG